LRLLPWSRYRSVQRDVRPVGLQLLPGNRRGAGDRASHSLCLLWGRRELQDLSLPCLQRGRCRSSARGPDGCLFRMWRQSRRWFQWARLPSLPRQRCGPCQNGTIIMNTSLKTSKDIATSLRSSAFRRASFDGRTIVLRSIPTWDDRADKQGPSFRRGRTKVLVAL
jgi:hypothetical protein